VGVKQSNQRAIRAFAIAPLVPSVLLWVFGTLGNPSWETLLPFVFGFSLFTYPITLIVGVPAYLLITHYGTLRFWHVLSIAGIAGGVVMALLLGKAEEAIVPFGACVGLAVGIAFWVLWVPPSPRG
jgi:hypothetical protein